MWVGWFDFGLQTTLGTFFLAMLEQFGENRTQTASVQSMFIGVNQGLGVFAGILITKFGITKVSLTGSILVPLGFFLSYFSSSLVHVSVCIGFLSAVGVSLMFVSSVVMLSRVFPQRQLPMAIALHSASISFAGLTYPFILDSILGTFDLHGSFLILSAYLFHNVAVSIFFSKTVANMESEDKRKLRNKNKKREKAGNNYERNQAFQDEDSSETVLENNQSSSNSDDYSISSPKNTVNGSFTDTGTFEGDCENRNATVSIKHATLNKTSVRETDKLDSVESCERQKIEMRNSISLKLRQYVSGLFSVPFLTILIATGIVIASQNGYVSLLTDIFESKGYKKDQGLRSFLMLNLSCLVARLLPAFLRQVQGVNLLIVAIVFSVCGCIGQVMILFSTNYILMMTGVGLTGIQMGGVISVASIFVAKLVGEKTFPVAFGLILTVTGILASSCGPAYGAVRDFSDSYSPVLLTGACVQLTGSMLFLFALFSGKKKFESVVPRAHIVTYLAAATTITTRNIMLHYAV
ncbi:uncharacterized protein LOC123550384 [Mercenaria mercenaria]|uniref:uncharacterized protein LOC123550384 n=1 Tax=Mercenaria mercenaria TaxID=6596 RepID=UPI00234F0D7E|nr:uncharacterized protein LOC123550384 [Mercenaria mercenaria]